MKTLLINASPHSNGDTSALIQALTARLRGEIVSFECYRRNVSPCVDCRRCLREPGCAIDDDMRFVFESLADADTVVLASPIYFSLPTPPAIALMSRFQTVYASRFRREKIRFPEKRGGILLTGGGSGGADSAEAVAKRLLRAAGVRTFGETVVSARTDHLPARADTNALAAAIRLANFLNASQ